MRPVSQLERLMAKFSVKAADPSCEEELDNSVESFWKPLKRLPFACKLSRRVRSSTKAAEPINEEEPANSATNFWNPLKRTLSEFHCGSREKNSSTSAEERLSWRR
jgi:hypothetical protein